MSRPIPGFREKSKLSEKGIGKNGQPFVFTTLPVDSSGVLPDGRTFAGIRDLERLLLTDEHQLALNRAKQLALCCRSSDPVQRPREIEAIVEKAKPDRYGLRTVVHQVVESGLFRNKQGRSKVIP